MKALSFTITTGQPLLLTSFAGDANSDVSYSYIPGSVIRGMLIGRYLKQHGLRELDLEDSAVYRLFFSGEQTCYLNGYPVSHEGNRTHPIPLSWKREKTDTLSKKDHCNIYDLAFEAAPSLDSPKSLGENFWHNAGGQVEIYRPQRRMSVHTQRDRQKGRATKDNGQVFRYEAIAQGESFQAVITCSDDDVQTLQDLLLISPVAWLGGSRSAGYGKVTLSEKPTLIDKWQPVSTRCATIDKTDNSTWVITLLSHTLIRDDNGQPIADATALKAAIEASLARVNMPTQLPAIHAARTFLGRELIGGFNRKWGLPLPQRVALAAGSVIAFEGAPLSPEQIERIEHIGIGERRVEGFGRLAINAWSKPAMTAQLADEGPSRQRSPAVSEPETIAAVQTIAERIFSQRLEQALMQETGRLEISPNNLSNAQLSRLELAARRGLSEGSFQPVIDLLKPDNLTKTARRQFESSQLKIGRRQYPFYDKLHTWIQPKPEKTSVDFEWLQDRNSDHSLDVVLTSNAACRLDDDTGRALAMQYTLRLIMSVAKRAKRAKQEKIS